MERGGKSNWMVNGTNVDDVKLNITFESRIYGKASITKKE